MGEVCIWQPYCHTLSDHERLVSQGGNFLFLFFCVCCGVFCPFCRSSLLRVAVWNTFSGVNFWVWVSVLVLCFSVVFCLCFCFMIWRFAPETVWKILLMSGLVCLGSSFLFLFFIDVIFICVFCFVERQSPGSNRTPPHATCTPWFCLFLFFFLSRRGWFPRVFGILLVLVPRPFFGREAARVFLCF